MIQLLPRVINSPGWLRKAKESRWRDRDMKIIKYIDDGLLIEKVNLKPVSLLEENKVVFKDINPPGSQKAFDHYICSGGSERNGSE